MRHSIMTSHLMVLCSVIYAIIFVEHRIFIGMLSIIVLSVIMLSVIVLSVIMLSVNVLNVVMLSVVSSFKYNIIAKKFPSVIFFSTHSWHIRCLCKSMLFQSP
jgi:hypothetical protein